jgi:tetratricopeptide (TPR) repeat protein
MARQSPRRVSVSAWFFLLALGSGCFPFAGIASAEDLRDLQKLYRAGEYTKCADAAVKVSQERPGDEDVWALRIRAEMQTGRYAEALKSLESAFRSSPMSIRLRWLGRDVLRFNGDAAKARLLEAEIATLLQQQAWRYGDLQSQIALGEFFLSQKVDPKKVLDGIYNLVKKRMPTAVEPVIACGNLALEKQDFALAAKHFEQALKMDETNPDVQFGIARAFAESEGDRADKAIKKTLELNPNYIPALLMVADGHIDAERYVEAAEMLGRVEAINAKHPLAAAYRAVIAHLQNEQDAERRARQLALSTWTENPEVDHVIGRKLSQKYRFAEGEACQRRALAFDPTYTAARLQLSQDLLRLGKEDEGWKLAREVSSEDEYNVVAHNLVTLEQNLSKFRTLEDDGFLVRMDAKEADIYGERVLDLLKRAKKTLVAKYGVELPQPVVIEMFPKQSDFAIRTFGLPGGAGFLGVCFGTVITANSPASQGESPSCWEATLWHEFCHVVTLTKTRNKMPRWLSEGISVFEEGQENKTWGQALTPQFRQMLLGDDFVPLSELSGAFLHAKSPAHLQFAYYESSLAVEYLVGAFGHEALREVLNDLSRGLAVNDALERHCAAREKLDRDFAEYARKRAGELGPKADWSEPELPRRADEATIADWLKSHPNNYGALARLAQVQMSAQKWDAATSTLENMKSLYPEDVRIYSQLATIYREQNRNRDEQAVLKRLVELTDDDLGAFARLAALAAAEQDWTTMRDMANRWLAVNPLQPAVHRVAAEAAEKSGDPALAVESYQSLLALDPIDPAGLHLQLAGAHEKQGQLAEARRHAILALEETPRFAAAHERLRSIVGKLKSAPVEDAPPPPPVAVPLTMRSSR